ncbi:nose resistant to fluoxetine protein 6-like [Bacillus rossius redtenbacheri]|uniref:nose resistant to fluoxetine protein 6-like n=1 Tax=Bacillus rossius redtenbacheri TaxID=93214 RepID=UPI002FDCEF0C
MVSRTLFSACCFLLLLGSRAEDRLSGAESQEDGGLCAHSGDRRAGVNISRESLSPLGCWPDVLRELSRGDPASSGDASDDCRRHSLMVADAIGRRELWALQMLDSSAKLPPGLLRGNANQLGDFDGCLSAREGSYCLASLDVSAGPAASEDLVRAVSLVRGGDFIRSSVQDPAHFVPRYSTLQWGVCVPASCPPAHVEAALVRSLGRLGASEAGLLRAEARVDPDMCYLRDRPPWGAAASAVTIFFCAVVALALFATLKDTDSNRLVADKGRLQRAALAFSLRRTLRQLTAPNGGELGCVHGLRALGTAALYIAHRVIALGHTPFRNRHAFAEVASQPWTMVLRASMVYTDSFLLLSGLLAAHSLSQELARRGRVDWRRRCLARYLRLTPALLALLLFDAYVWEHLGQGPMWNRLVVRNSNLCKRFLWRNLLYLQNFFPFQDMCAPHTHQLALDMQLFLAGPLLAQLLLARPWLGAGLLAGLNAWSALLRHGAASEHRLSVVVHHGQTVEQLYKAADHLYIIPTHRATPYLLGIALGCVLHNAGKKTHIPQVVAAAGWAAAAWAARLSLWPQGAAAASPDYRHDAAAGAAYAALSPLCWSLALGWVVLACHSGRGGFVNSFLTWRVLAPISRISYSVYLTQFTIFFYNAGMIRSEQEFHILKSIDGGEVLATLAVSVAMTLLFDLPLQEVKSILMERGPVKKTLTKTNSNNNNK